jgi:hypothetical protein
LPLYAFSCCAKPVLPNGHGASADDGANGAQFVARCIFQLTGQRVC